MGAPVPIYHGSALGFSLYCHYHIGILHFLLIVFHYSCLKSVAVPTALRVDLGAFV